MSENQFGAEILSMLANGYVGIGTIAPASLLHAASGNATQVTIENTGGNGDNAVVFKTPSRQWNIGQNIGATGTGSFNIYDVSAGAARLVIETNGLVRPGLDNAQPFGTGSARWSVIYAATGSINTSDARTKEQIETIPDEWLDAWSDVVWSRFRFCDAVERKGDDARWHLGLIAQQVRDVFAARDLDAMEIGLLCFDRWDAQAATPPIEEQRSADGEVIVPASPGSPGREAGDRWGLRYDECQAMEAAWQRRRIAQLEARLDALAAGAA